MTIAYMTVTMFAPITIACAILAWVCKLGFGRAVRSLAAAIWALSLAVPAATQAFRTTFAGFYVRTMESA